MKTFFELLGLIAGLILVVCLATLVLMFFAFTMGEAMEALDKMYGTHMMATIKAIIAQ